MSRLHGTAPSPNIPRETAIGAVINLALTWVFFALIFRGAPMPPVWGMGGLVFDALPQGFMVGLMSALAPLLIARGKAAKAGVLTSGTDRLRLPRIGLIALGCGLSAMAGLVAGAALIAALTGAMTAPWPTALGLKLFGSLMITVCVTPAVLRTATRSGRGTHPLSEEHS